MTVPPYERQQLGDNWRPQQFGHWRSRGYDCLGPSATEILMLILDGVVTIRELSNKVGLTPSVTRGHVRRLRGLGLVAWTCNGRDPIRSLCQHVDLSDYWPIILE
jgi:hypothetical protein